ncbi:MAG: CinA family protein [Eubacteriales bacterium]|nr:CinA family protein [Eubacteriales bacterium]
MRAAQRALKLLRENNQTLCCAESFTGGLMANAIISSPNASDVFLGSAVVYTEKAKHKVLNVPKKTLKSYGAVSSNTAAILAKNARKLYNADYALATTGFAGPTGDKIGLCFIGLSTKDNCLVYRINMNGTRNDIRKAATQAAYKILINFMKGNNHGKKRL